MQGAIDKQQITSLDKMANIEFDSMLSYGDG